MSTLTENSKWARRCLDALFVVSLLALAATFTPVSRWMVVPLRYTDQPQQTDVIIVLGGGVLTDLRSLPWGVQERVEKGIALYRAGYAPVVVLSGGLVRGQTYAESEVMHEYATLLGLPAAVIVEENRSLSTRENAENTIALMEQRGWKTATVVTSDFHEHRACRVFWKLGLPATCVAAPRADGDTGNYLRNLNETRSVIREYLATVYYSLRGYL
ncbi:MAG: YdcF family protein [Patescibacteria group bacterium]